MILPRCSKHLKQRYPPRQCGFFVSVGSCSLLELLTKFTPTAGCASPQGWRHVCLHVSNTPPPLRKGFKSQTGVNLMNSIKIVSFGNFPVSFQDNGYLNATVVASHFNRRVGNYLKSERTQEYISALAEKLSVTPKRATKDNQIVIIKQGGTEQGTWLHPKLAVDFARWLDPKFAVWCDEQIEQILSGSLIYSPLCGALILMVSLAISQHR